MADSIYMVFDIIQQDILNIHGFQYKWFSNIKGDEDDGPTEKHICNIECTPYIMTATYTVYTQRYTDNTRRLHIRYTSYAEQQTVHDSPSPRGGSEKGDPKILLTHSTVT